VPAPQDGSNPAMVSKMGGAGWPCPFVLIVLSYSNDENSRSRQRDGPASANVRARNLQRNKNLKKY
jgi:hypothetical protein